MPDDSIFRSADPESLGTLPTIDLQDRQVLDRLLWLAPDVAVATASAVIGAHQPDLSKLMFPREKGPDGAVCTRG